ncbi:protein tamozhennic [Anthonomus grandis grandis]|uniref:protein tamozhennic n=1 Tax=Anthonomus grandis grandis TaxID=2921223 RepID=UPI0021659E2B|nr:protein tamozhennic [Anthonomus grandis grandis]
MVIMENYNSYPQDKCRDLWLRIDRLHLSYLEMEESTEKIMHRAKLEECIADFLFLAHHRDKFVFGATEDVLYRSAAFKKDFSGYKAATGWNALQIYAANLITQPWRREYRQIKTYCGFYKHQIEANLVGVETVFEVMGYKHVGNGVLELDGPICPDRVSNISRDCLVAYMECQILKHIWEELSPLFNISWLDILEHRSSFPGNLDQCIESIKLKYTSRQFQQSIRQAPREDNVPSFENNHRYFKSSAPNQALMPNNHNMVQKGHGYSGLAGHNHVALPAVVVPPVPYCVPMSNGCQSGIPTYAYGSFHPSHMPLIKPPPTAMVPNGFYYPTNPPLPVHAPPIYPVPTGQLIELDARNGYDLVDGDSTARTTRRSTRSDCERQEEQRVRRDSLSKNGAEVKVSSDPEAPEENWDYVYKNLERQGYSKDLGERGDVLTSSEKKRKSSREGKKMKATNLDEVFQGLTVTERPLKVTEALEQMEKKVAEKHMQPRERRLSHGSSYENVPAAEPQKQTKTVSNGVLGTNRPLTVKETVEVKSQPVTLEKNVNVEVNKQKESNFGVSSVPPQKWECKSCTYINEVPKDICEMCSKSRYMGQDQPMEVGGPECSKCTLVNPRNAKSCQACGSSLKNSPTYI